MNPTKKRVLIFIPEFPVRTETFIEREVSQLAQMPELDVSVFSVKQGRGELSEASQKITKYRKLNLIALIKGLFYLITKPKKSFKAFKILGFSRFYLFIKSLGYTSLFAKFNPDIIYAHFLSTPSTIALVASIILDVPLGISAHARDILEYPDLPKEKAQYAKFIAICNKNACEKAKSLSELENPENIKLIYHGLNPKSLELDEPVEKDSPPLIFSVGRYVEKKGLKYLIEATSLLQKKNLDFSVAIAGGGPLEKELNDQIKELGLEDKIRLVGSLPFEQIKEFYHRASVYVQPAINVNSGDADGVPNTLIEAAMLKLPIVTTDAGSIRDFLGEDSAALVDQKNSEQLAREIEKILTGSADYKAKTEIAYSKSLEMFDLVSSARSIQYLLLS